MITPVILSGGSGTRLWPLSTPERPKQFLPLIGETSLFAQTLDRVRDRARYNAPIVVGSALHELLCKDALAEYPGGQLILEPVARNTAVAIAMAAVLATESHPNTMLLVMPSDHRVGDEEAFHNAVSVGREGAEAGLLVTFGVHPTRPDTGFGYLEAGKRLNSGTDLYSVARFKEKPDADLATAMIQAGNHYWNGGIFMFRADQFLEQCQRLAPEIYRCATSAMELAKRDGGICHPSRRALEDCPNVSVDYAVMERSTDIAMVPLDADWSDVGSWDALASLADERGEFPLNALDSHGCYVRTDGLKVALLGVDDLIVVGQGDQVAIMKRGRSQDIKRLAAKAANDYHTP